MDLTKKITKFIPSNRNIVGDNAIADNWQQDEQRRHQTRHFENSNEEKFDFFARGTARKLEIVAGKEKRILKKENI